MLFLKNYRINHATSYTIHGKHLTQTLKIGFSSFLFITVTYSEQCKHKTWSRVNKDIHTYIKTIKRKFPTQTINFLRTIEQHKTGSPHGHILLHFSTPLRIENSKYIDTKLFKLIERLWPEGHCKAEVLKHHETTHAVSYILKYVIKDITRTNTNNETSYNNVKQIRLLWPLRGRRHTKYNNTFRILAWSKGFQHIYLQAQIKRLVLRKNADPFCKHIKRYSLSTKSEQEITLSSPDLKLIHKYKLNLNHTNGQLD